LILLGEYVSEVMDMSGYIMFTELTTPLKLIGIRIFRDENGHYWYKVRKNSRKRIFSKF
jgi:hypothetical protein